MLFGDAKQRVEDIFRAFSREKRYLAQTPSSPQGIFQKALRSSVPDPAPCAEEAPASRQAINIDALSASPWVGLHYSHEFLLHYRHDLLVRHHEN